MLFQPLCSSIAGTRPTANASTDSPVCPRLRGEAHDQAGGTRENGVGEGGHDTAEEEHHREVSAGVAGFGDGAAEVEDVLGEREACRDREGEHHTVHRSVEVSRGEDQEHQQPQGLSEFLHHRRLDRHGERRIVQSRGRPRHQRKIGLDQHRHRYRDGGAPGKGEKQQRLGLRFPAVDEAHRQQHGPQRNQRGDEANDKAGDSGPVQEEGQDQEEADECEESAGQHEANNAGGTAAARYRRKGGGSAGWNWPRLLAGARW